MISYDENARLSAQKLVSLWNAHSLTDTMAYIRLLGYDEAGRVAVLLSKWGEKELEKLVIEIRLP